MSKNNDENDMSGVQRHLILQQLDRKIAGIRQIGALTPPAKGWVNTLRTALRMPLRYLGGKLGISAQSVKEMEQREASGSITLNSLREAAEAMDMKLVYALVPKDGSLEEMVERRARQLAIEIVGRTAQNMKLEDQENEREHLDKAIEETAADLKREMPRYLWD